jgi:histidine ammonia-lyase
VLCGERDVLVGEQRRPTAEVFAEQGITAYRLKPKEGLALMNGTAVMTALSVLAFTRCSYLAQLTSRISALAVQALDGNPYHFDEDLFAAKPHPGQNQVAARMRADLHAPSTPRNSPRLQDRYSTRCAPHVIGVVEDALPWWRQFLETELNSANDNPLIDAEKEKVMHGGHFYGGHVAFAMDSMKQACANLADLLDRQLAQLVDAFKRTASNHSGARQNACTNHGYKAGVRASGRPKLKLTGRQAFSAHRMATIKTRSTWHHSCSGLSARITTLVNRYGLCCTCRADRRGSTGRPAGLCRRM